MILTRNGQSIYDLTDEFIAAMKKMKSGGEDGEKLCQRYLDMETDGCNDEEREILDKELKLMNYDIRKIDFIGDMDLKVSDVFMAYFNTLLRGIPMLMTAIVGFYAVKFYETHPANDTLTLTWALDFTGKGKLITYQQFFLWFAATKIDNTRSVFDVMTPEELYRYKKQE